VRDRNDVGGHPEALALSADGERIYVGDYWSGTVTVFSVHERGVALRVRLRPLG
jgi:DNA-binding beta-propeller fold protein YncE